MPCHLVCRCHVHLADDCFKFEVKFWRLRLAEGFPILDTFGFSVFFGLLQIAIPTGVLVELPSNLLAHMHTVIGESAFVKGSKYIDNHELSFVVEGQLYFAVFIF